MSESRISLRLLTSADLPLIRPWFEEPDTSRFLGGPEWATEPPLIARIASRWLTGQTRSAASR
jgi:RimJ/RimL family protein N-acetyltransferase